MAVHRNLDRLIVVVSVLGLLSPITRGSADSIVDRRAEESASSVRATSSGCLVMEPRFPVVVEVPIVMSAAETSSNVRAEVVAIGSGAHASNRVDVDVRVEADGIASARVSWWGDGSRKRAPFGAYEVSVAMPSGGRSTTCVNVERPNTAKAADRIRPPDGSNVEVIVIGRSEQRGGAK